MQMNLDMMQVILRQIPVLIVVLIAIVQLAIVAQRRIKLATVSEK